MHHAQAELRHFLVVRRAHVHVQLVNFRRLLVVEAVLAQMNRRVPDDPAHRPLVPEEIQPPPARRRPIAAADAIHANPALLGDLLDDVADLVRVPLDHHAARLLRAALERRPRRAVSVVLDRVGKLPGIFCPDTLAGHLEARRARGAEEVKKKVLRWFVHAARGYAHSDALPR
jgi:hypothetical protein